MNLSLLLLLLWASTARGVLYPKFRTPTAEDVHMPHISYTDIDEAFEYADKQAKSRMNNEKEFAKNASGHIILKTTVTADARLLGEVSNTSMQEHRVQEKLEDAARYLIHKYNLTKLQTRVGLPRLSVEDKAPVKECQTLLHVHECNKTYPYRTADGSCNNLNNPSWGRVYTAYKKFITPDYADGFTSPRLSSTNTSLPSPRNVSNIVDDYRNVTSLDYTHMAMAFGQFLDHDLAMAISPSAGDANDIFKCCPFNASVTMPDSCFPIQILKDDTFYSEVSQDCMSMVRSVAGCNDCKLGSPRQQISQQTAYIDASVIYGVSEDETRGLRANVGGRVKNQKSQYGPMLPESFEPPYDQCSGAMDRNKKCFQAGDGRANAQPGLIAMHTIWSRHHNNIADILARDYPNAGDETLFQETRRIIGAQLQAVAYNGLLPLVLGKDWMKFFGLEVLKNGNTEYDETVDASLATEFSSAAMRFGHSLIQDLFQETGPTGDDEGEIDIQDNTFHPMFIHEGKLDSVTRGLCHQGAQQFDRHFADGMRNHALETPGSKFGLDLVSINIQRGRDHGLPSYTEMLNYCFNVSVNTFEDLRQLAENENLITEDNVKLFERAYQSPKDIDAYPGGFSETPISGGLVGPTFACFIGKQFQNLKLGDRFYFEHKNKVGNFTPGQLTELRKTTLAAIICNSTQIEQLTKDVFRMENTTTNPLVDCKTIQDESPQFKKWLDLK